jgi:hypothetical protein
MSPCYRMHHSVRYLAAVSELLASFSFREFSAENGVLAAHCSLLANAGTPPKTETAAAATAATAATAAAAAATAAATAAAATAAQDDGCGGEAEESAHDVTSEKGEKTDVGFVPNDGSGSGSRGGKVTGGGNSTVGDFSRPSSEMSFVHPAPDGSCREGPGQFQIRARSMSMGALDNLVDSSLHSADGSVGRMTDVNNRIFEVQNNIPPHCATLQSCPCSACIVASASEQGPAHDCTRFRR